MSPRVPLSRIALEWARIGVTGFGGPPAHIALLRALIVDRGWIPAAEFEDAIAACNLLPGPASTQLAMLCARRLAGPLGAVVGGLCFILPAVVLILLLSVLFLSHAPPVWVRGAGAGAGAAVAAVALHAGIGLVGPSWRRAQGSGVAGDHRAHGSVADNRRARGSVGDNRRARGSVADNRRARGSVADNRRARWIVYVLAGGVAAALIGPYLVLVLAACGLGELVISRETGGLPSLVLVPRLATIVGSVTVGGLGAVAWVAFKVGALSYGGGFVIVPLMQHDAVHTFHWMSASRFLDAVALGQITPGPVVATVSAVGYAAHGLVGGVLAAAVAFTPSFAFVLIGGPHFDRIRGSERAQTFLRGAGAAAIGAILGSSVPLASALSQTWQLAALGAATLALLVARRGVVTTLLAAGGIGVIVAAVGGPVPR